MNRPGKLRCPGSLPVFVSGICVLYLPDRAEFHRYITGQKSRT